MQMQASPPADEGELRRFLDDSRADGADELGFARYVDGSVLCRAAGRPSMRLCERLAASGAGERELTRLEVLLSILAPTRVGYWQQWGGVARRGWYFPCRLAVERARGAAFLGWPNQRLGMFCVRHGLFECSEISHATDGGGELWLRLDLPRSDQSLPIALDAFATLAADPPARILWDDLSGAELSVEVALQADDAKVRLRVAQPGEPLVDRAYRALGRRRPSAPRLGEPTALWIEPRGESFRLAVEHSLRR
jgi:hypothetical protein